MIRNMVKVKGKEQCKHFGNPDPPPRECNCNKCQDIGECATKAGFNG